MDDSTLTFDLLTKQGENYGSSNSSESLDSNATLVSETDSAASSNLTSSTSSKMNRISQGNMSNSASISSSLYYVDYNHASGGGGQAAGSGTSSSAPPGSLASNSNRSSICSNSTLTQSSIGSFGQGQNLSFDSAASHPENLNGGEEEEEDAEGEADLVPLPPPPPELRIGAPTRMFSTSSSAAATGECDFVLTNVLNEKVIHIF